MLKRAGSLKGLPRQRKTHQTKIRSGARDEVSRHRFAALHSGGKPRRESGLTKKEPRKCRTGARIRGVKSAEVARGLL